MGQFDHLYAADAHWWHHHIHDINMGFTGKRWSCEPLNSGNRSNWGSRDTDEWGIAVLDCDTAAKGLSRNKTLVHSGSNSGYQAINLAYHFLGEGGGRIILLGFDMCTHSGLSHFFGDHPKEFANGKGPERFIPNYRTIKPGRYGIDIINCSRVTALDAFPCYRLEDMF